MAATKSRRRAGALAIVLIAVIGVASFVLVRNAPHGPLGLRSCSIAGHAAQCGAYNAPENPAQPNGKRIRLNVAVFRATNGHPKADPLFWFAGWGSGGVSDDAANLISTLRRVNVDRDVVFIDQRGTGSSKVECALPGGRRAPTPTAITAAASRCAERVGPGLRYYTSVIAVDDFDRIRQLLGYSRINIYGVSYGVTTGQIYLLRHGTHVRSAVFDSGSLLDVRIFERAAPSAQRALELLFARCAADTQCSTGHPRLRQQFAQVMSRLARAPVSLPRLKLHLDQAGFASVVEEMLATYVGKAHLPGLIQLAATSQFAKAAALGRPYVTGGSSQLAYQLLIQCNEQWASRRPASIAHWAHGTFMATSHRQAARALAAACKALPAVAVPRAIGQRVHSKVPVLFLVGNEDPTDPPANVAHARRELPASRTVVFPVSGHGQLGLLCGQNLIADFVSAGSARGLDTSCAKTALRSEFATD